MKALTRFRGPGLHWAAKSALARGGGGVNAKCARYCRKPI